MSAFNRDDGSRRAMIWIDNRFHIDIRRFTGYLVIRVYPITDGEIWDAPYDSFTIADDQIEILERAMKE